MLLIGYSGSGKSTLAEKLFQLLLHSQTPYRPIAIFSLGGKIRDHDWMLKEMKTFLSKHEDWVIDGNYTWCCYEERMEQADQIIFLNFSAMELFSKSLLNAI